MHWKHALLEPHSKDMISVSCQRVLFPAAAAAVAATTMSFTSCVCFLPGLARGGAALGPHTLNSQRDTIVEC